MITEYDERKISAFEVERFEIVLCFELELYLWSYMSKSTEDEIFKLAENTNICWTVRKIDNEK